MTTNFPTEIAAFGRRWARAPDQITGDTDAEMYGDPRQVHLIVFAYHGRRMYQAGSYYDKMLLNVAGASGDADSIEGALRQLEASVCAHFEHLRGLLGNRQQEEVERLRAALIEIAHLPTYGIKDPHGFKQIAQAALDVSQQKGLKDE